MAIAYPVNYKFNVRSTQNVEIRSIRTEFGDGYQQVTPDGVNYLVRNGNIVHELLTISEASTLRTFLRANCGTSTVVTIPNYFETPDGNSTMNVYLESWSERYAGSTYTFTIKYREAFNV